MSFTATKAVWADQTITDPIELVLMLALGDYANEQFEAWPAIATLARRTRMSERGVRKIISRLKERKKLVVLPPKGGPKFTNTYVLTPEPQTGVKEATPERCSAPPCPPSTLPLNVEHITPEHGSADPSGSFRNDHKNLSPEQGTGVGKKNGKEGVRVKTFEEYRRDLFAMYSRPDSQRMGPTEVHTLTVMMERPGFAEELISLQSFQRTDKYFPQSMIRLLEKWQETLDRSRLNGNNQPGDHPALNRGWNGRTPEQDEKINAMLKL